MPLDPQVLAMRDRAAGSRPLYELTVEQARAEDLRAIRAAGGTPEPVASVVDDHVPGPAGDLPVRIYRPADPRGLLVYFFGGGWTLGTIDTSDGVCRALTNAARCVTVAVGYRRAPEHPFPAAIDDCFAATTWLAGRTHEPVAVGGDSAGGNLAAGVTLLARDAELPIRHQLLVYPNTDYLSDTASLRENNDPAFFNRTSVDWYWRHYLRDPGDGGNPLASPLRAADLSGLPPATVITAEYDPLRDQAEQYAERLRAAGVPVELTRYPGMVHGFFTMSGVLDAAADAVAHAAARLRDAFA
ncbi:MAG TPA: alpha/beta hydrolase [Pseudonocardiaceae bacterium]|nr:alpha/beta hydrolase [Pseudonocardiaceae bacterium]